MRLVNLIVQIVLPEVAPVTGATQREADEHVADAHVAHLRLVLQASGVAALAAADVQRGSIFNRGERS